MSGVLPVLVLAETKPKCPSLLQVHHGLPEQLLLALALPVPGAPAPGAATSLRFMSKARLHRSQKVLPFILHNVLLHESRVQKETRLSEMMDAVHSGAHSSEVTLDLLCAY